jgi:hypothetical protein
MKHQEGTPLEEDWIVCVGATHTVVDGLVACPLNGGRAVPVVECVSCRFLAWRHDERDGPASCATPEG